MVAVVMVAGGGDDDGCDGSDGNCGGEWLYWWQRLVVVDNVVGNIG